MKRSVSHYIRLSTLFVIALNTLVLLVWTVSREVQNTSNFSFTTVNPLTALLLILISVWIGIKNRKRDGAFHKELFLIAFVVAGAALVKAAQLLSAHNFSIDWTLFPSKTGKSRMAQTSVINFLLLSLPMLFVKRKTRVIYLAHFMALAVLFLSLLTIISYVIDDPDLYKFTSHVPMALYTAFSFLLLSMAVILVEAEKSFIRPFLSSKMGGTSARRLFPYAVVLPITLTYVNTRLQSAHWYSEAFGIAVQDGLMIFILLGIVWNTTRTLNKIDRNRAAAEEGVRQKSESLLQLIAELKEKDQTLALMKELQFLSDTIPQIIWTATPDGNLDYYNQHWFDYTGLNREQTKDWGWKPVIHPDDLHSCIERWTHCYTTGEDYEIEYRFKRASDGEYRWHLGRASAMRDEMGQIIKWFGTCTDIDDQKRMHEELKRNNEELNQFRNMAVEELKEKSQLLNGVLKNLPVIVYRINADGIAVESLGSGLQLIGLKDKEAVGMDVYKVYPDMRSKVRLANQRGIYVYQSSVPHDGREVYFETYIFPDDLYPGGALCFSIDITERKKAENLLQQAKLQAEEASFFKTRFLANMSHEIRTPLNAVLGFAKILKDSSLSKKQQLEYLHHIETSGAMLLKLIGDVLDVSKIEEGKLTLSKEPFHFVQTIESALSPYKFKAGEKGLDFSLMMDPGITPHLIGDAGRINQILINLLGNALKFTKEGKISVSISLKQRRVEPEDTVLLLFAIQDTGVGIAAEKQALVFESFTQADSSIAREFGGSGLGLSIVNQLITLMGGSICVKTPPFRISDKGGVGSLFEFTIPLLVDRKKKNDRDVQSNREAHKSVSGLKVLVAEDNPLNQKLAHHMLSKIGCTITFAVNGQEALERLVEQDFDLVLMDVQMPVMDGLRATKAIREDLKQSLPIIGLTANVFKDDIESCLSAGMNDHLGKPYNEEQLAEKLCKWAGREIVKGKAIEYALAAGKK